MSTVDTSTWSPDTDLNTAIEGIPLNADSPIAQTWLSIRVLMAALKGDGDDIRALLVPFDGATASADGASGLVPKPEAGDQNKVLKGDGTWGTAPTPNLGTASRAMQTDANGNIAVSSVTTPELGYLSGVTSAIQTQLNGKADVEDVSSTFSWENGETPARFFAYRTGKLVHFFMQGAAKTHAAGATLGTTTLSLADQSYLPFVKNDNAYGVLQINNGTIKVGYVSNASAASRIYVNGAFLLA